MLLSLHAPPTTPLIKTFFHLLQHSQQLDKLFNDIRLGEPLPHSARYVKFWYCVDSFNRYLGLCYPYFPTEQDFIHSTENTCSYTQKGELYLLHHFAQEWPRFQTGGLLLPDLVEFYQWLHTALGEPALGDGNSCCVSCCMLTEYRYIQIYAVLKPSTNTLAHQVTKEHARTLSIGRVVELAAQRYSKEEGEHTQALYNRVKGRFLTLKMGAITIVCTHSHLHRWLQPVCET